MRNGKVEHSAGPILRHHGDVRNISIGDDVHLPFEIPQNRRPQGHTFDDTRKIANLHNVPDAELVFKQADVLREWRRRVKDEFDKAGIELAQKTLAHTETLK